MLICDSTFAHGAFLVDQPIPCPQYRAPALLRGNPSATTAKPAAH